MYLCVFKDVLSLYAALLFLIIGIPSFQTSFFSYSLNIDHIHQGFHGNFAKNPYYIKNTHNLSHKLLNMSSCVCVPYTFIGYIPSKSRFRSKSVLSSKKFNFDERAARRARHRREVTENMLRKKLAKRTMRKIVESVKRTSEEHKELQVQKFISEVQYNPNRKRLPTPPDIYSPSYDALLYLKGIPYMATEKMVFEWLKEYEVVNVVFIKNENGFFSGDAYVRCQNIQVRDKAAKEMANKMMGGRYIQVFKVNENAYLEYYHSGCRKEPKDRNYVDPSVLVITNNQYRKLLNTELKRDEDSSVPEVSFVNNINSSLDIGDIKTGVRLVGTVTEIYRNGVIVDCNISETRDGVKEKVFCILKRSRIAKNIGLQGQQYEWLRMKQLILYPGIKLNLYVEKVRETTAQNTFDQDMWTEHFHKSLIETYFKNDLIERTSNSDNILDGLDSDIVKGGSENVHLKGFDDSEVESTNECSENVGEKTTGTDAETVNIGLNGSETSTVTKIMNEQQEPKKRSLVYLTMDSSVSEDKVLWWEKKILNEVLSRHQTRNFNDIVLKEEIKETIKNDKTFKNKVKVKEVHEGKRVVYGNLPDKILLSKDKGDVSDKQSGKTKDSQKSSSKVEEDKENTNKPQFNLYDKSSRELNVEAIDSEGNYMSDHENKHEVELPDDVPIGTLLNHKMVDNDRLFLLEGEENGKEDKIEFVDMNYKKLAKRFFKNTTYEKDIQFHDFDLDKEDFEESEEVSEQEGSEDYDWTLKNEAKMSLDSYPKFSLAERAIKIPPNGLILRESEVGNLTNEQLKGVLDLLNKKTKGSRDENRRYLLELIKNEGIPNESLPQALIQRGLQKVKKSKKYMKKIVNLTKDLTERKFSQEDLEAATAEELQMLVEEGLYKFLNWNPPFDIKKQFITNYRHLLEDNLNLPTIKEVVPNPDFIKRTEDMESTSDDQKLFDPDDENARVVEKMWNDMKWLIVIFIYGEQGDLGEIVKQLEMSKSKSESQAKLESIIIQSKED